MHQSNLNIAHEIILKNFIIYFIFFWGQCWWEYQVDEYLTQVWCSYKLVTLKKYDTWIKKCPSESQEQRLGTKSWYYFGDKYIYLTCVLLHVTSSCIQVYLNGILRGKIKQISWDQHSHITWTRIRTWYLFFFSL